MNRDGLALDHVRIALDGRELLDIDAHVAPGEVLTVMGPSGSGKSSLLAYVGGFLDPAFEASGRVRVGDVDLTALAPEDRHAGILFQDPLLFPHMSVAGNLVFALPQGSGSRAQRRQKAELMLAEVGLEGMADRDPDTLSGGQRARVALARVLLSRPRTLLLDEPFSKLDADLRQQMRELVFAKAGAAGLPTILVTHDAADAMAAGGPILRIANGG
jgi:putative thiamine transport system ATP-binding protein